MCLLIAAAVWRFDTRTNVIYKVQFRRNIQGNTREVVTPAANHNVARSLFVMNVIVSS